MKGGGLDKLCEQAGIRAANRVRMGYDNWKYGIESPIERLFVLGLFCLIEMHDYDFIPIEDCEVWEGDGETIRQEVRDKLKKRGMMLIQYQHKLLDWRADFVLSCPSISTAKVIVECDGHDFHERTKEQAARDRKRDRAAQAAGYTIFRFTGSEIYRDPMACSEAALNAVVKAIEPAWLDSIEK